MRGRSWSDEQIALLRTMWAAGATAQAIAERLAGPSRSAVLGKVFRLRLDTGPVPGEAKKARRRGPSPALLRESFDAGVATFADAALVRRRPGRSKKPEPVAPPIPGRCGKSLLELSNQCCRWPHGRPGTDKFFFCGAPGADVERGIPYCSRHMRCAYPALDPVADVTPTPKAPHARGAAASTGNHRATEAAMATLRRIVAGRVAGL